jgi:Uma2 family endonuclease
MEGVTATMTETPPFRVDIVHPHPDMDTLWTIDDLRHLPEGNRYQIVHGSLLVSPAPNVPHCRVTTTLDRLLDRQAPSRFYVSAAGFGISIRGGDSYLVPDVVVLRRSALAIPAPAILPPDVLLVVEVLSPSNPNNDRVKKRHEYAEAGIPHYWIVDRDAETLTVLSLADGTQDYVESAVVRIGRRWQSEVPFPLTVDLAEVLT